MAFALHTLTDAPPQLMDFYRNPKNDCKHLQPYTNLIYDSPVVPVIVDADGAVLSLPPLINGK